MSSVPNFGLFGSYVSEKRVGPVTRLLCLEGMNTNDKRQFSMATVVQSRGKFGKRRWIQRVQTNLIGNERSVP